MASSSRLPPELPTELVSAIGLMVDKASTLIVCSSVCQSWRNACNVPSAWKRLALMNFPNLSRTLTALNIAQTEDIDWRALFKEHHALARIETTAKHTACTRSLKDFVFTFELVNKELLAAVGSSADILWPHSSAATTSWTGTLTEHDGEGGPYANMWDSTNQPAFAQAALSFLAAVQAGESTTLRAREERLRRQVRFRIFVSKVTANGRPRTIKLYDAPLIRFGNYPADGDDWLAFESAPAPVVKPILDAFDHTVENPSVPYRFEPNLKLSNGWVDELMWHKSFSVDGGTQIRPLFTARLLEYLEHLAPW